MDKVFKLACFCFIKTDTLYKNNKLKNHAFISNIQHQVRFMLKEAYNKII